VAIGDELYKLAATVITDAQTIASTVGIPFDNLVKSQQWLRDSSVNTALLREKVAQLYANEATIGMTENMAKINWDCVFHSVTKICTDKGAAGLVITDIQLKRTRQVSAQLVSHVSRLHRQVD